jgi:F-type H+-transporting ATPase subunit epsilon
MARTLILEIVTPERIVYRQEVNMVVASAVDGEIGILPLHEPLVTVLRPGEIHARYGDDQTEYFAISGGYLQVHEDKVIVLADRAELATSIDVGRARESKQAIEQRLSELPPEDVAREEYDGDLRWFEVQMQAVAKAK